MLRRAKQGLSLIEKPTRLKKVSFSCGSNLYGMCLLFNTFGGRMYTIAISSADDVRGSRPALLAIMVVSSQYLIFNGRKDFYIGMLF